MCFVTNIIKRYMTYSDIITYFPFHMNRVHISMKYNTSFILMPYFHYLSNCCKRWKNEFINLQENIQQKKKFSHIITFKASIASTSTKPSRLRRIGVWVVTIKSLNKLQLFWLNRYHGKKYKELFKLSHWNKIFEFRHQC